VQPPVGEDCYDGTCTDVTFAMDEYSLKVPGPWAVAVHVIDGLGEGEAAAEVGSLTDTAYDPAQANTDILGAAVYRDMKQTYVVASSAEDGATGDSMTYGVPGASTARHIVFDAPEDADGKSLVSAHADGDRCVLTITAGNGFIGHPLMFQVTTAADSCNVSEDTDVPPGTAPPPDTVHVPMGGTGGTGSTGGGGGADDAGSTNDDSGCACNATGASSPLPVASPFALLALTLLITRRRSSTGQLSRQLQRPS